MDHILTDDVINKIIGKIVSIAEAKDPSVYLSEDGYKGEVKEKGFQRFVAEELAKQNDVFRELGVSIPDEKGNSKKNVDIAVRIPGKDGGSQYVVGELKFHGAGMENRDFIDGEKTDIRRMSYIRDNYDGVSMVFSACMTYSKNEAENLVSELKREKKFTCVSKVLKNGYHLVIYYKTASDNMKRRSYSLGDNWQCQLKNLKAEEKDRRYFSLHKN